MSEGAFIDNRISAYAVAEILRPGLWSVDAWGDPPYARNRSYVIDAANINEAAQEGIRRFVEEMENLGPFVDEPEKLSDKGSEAANDVGA